LPGVVRSGLCGGHGNGARDVGVPWPIQWPGKCSFKTSRTERAKCAGAPSCCSHTSSRSPLSFSLGRVTSPTLPNKMPHSPVHQKSKVQSGNLMSYLPISSHAVDYVPAPAWNWDSPLTRTPHFCRTHCDRWHIHNWKEPSNGIWHLRMGPAEHGMILSADPCRHPTVHSQKLGVTASHSSRSSCGLALLTVARQALTIVSVSTSLGNVQWKRQPLRTFPSALSFSHSAACL